MMSWWMGSEVREKTWGTKLFQLNVFDKKWLENSHGLEEVEILDRFTFVSALHRHIIEINGEEAKMQ